MEDALVDGKGGALEETHLERVIARLKAAGLPSNEVGLCALGTHRIDFPAYTGKRRKKD